jgi:catechol 2,3-dioxygenase
VTWRYPGALFISAGGYHHHVGLNVWAAGSPPASATDVRMLFWELVFPTAAERDEAAERLHAAGFRSVETAVDSPCFADPWGITVALVVERAAAK